MRWIERFARLVGTTLTLLLVGAWLLTVGDGRPGAAHAAPAAPGPAGVTLAHYAPFAADPLSTAVTIRIQGGPVFSDVFSNVIFGDRITGVTLPAGSYTVTLTPTGALTPVVSVSHAFSEGAHYTLAAVGGANGWPLDLLRLPAEAPPLAGKAQLRVVHLSPFTTTLPATAVDVCDQTGAPVPGLTGIVYGQTTAYRALAPGLYDLKVARADTNCAAVVLDLPPAQMAADQVADLLVVGLPGDPALPLRADVPAWRARVALGHFAPFANTVTDTAVTVRVAGQALVTGLVYGELTPYQALPLGQHLLEVIPAGGNAPVLTGTAVISGYVDYTFAVIGDRLNQPLALIRLLDDNVTPPPAGAGRLRLSHLAPVAGDVAATRVDLCNQADRSILVDDLAYRETRVLALPAGIYRVYVSVGSVNCLLPLLNVPPFAVAAGRIAYAYAIGDLIRQPPSLVVKPDLTPASQYLPFTTR